MKVRWAQAIILRIRGRNRKRVLCILYGVSCHLLAKRFRGWVTISHESIPSKSENLKCGDSATTCRADDCDTHAAVHLVGQFVPAPYSGLRTFLFQLLPNVSYMHVRPGIDTAESILTWCQGVQNTVSLCQAVSLDAGACSRLPWFVFRF